MKKEYINIECFEVEQPLGKFYVGKISYQDLISISYADVRRIEKEGNSEIETYFGIQRSLSKNRIKEISEYVKNVDATFPSSILLAIKSIDIESKGAFENVKYDKDKKILKIIKDENIAHIIDGQHRLFGLKKSIEDRDLFEDNFKFELIVTIFIDMDIDDQAMVFSTINKAHTKVNKSLVYDLYDLAKTKSPQRTAHNIIRLLNEKTNSPFKDKVKMLGVADDKEKETITQATLVELILKYMSKNPMKDRDILKRGLKLDKLQENKQDILFFRNWFIEEKEEYIAKILWNYFSAIKNKWNSAWIDNTKILSKSTGIIALMRFLKNVINNIGIGRIIEISEFEAIFNKVELTDDDFTNDKYKSGGVGQSQLYKDLLESIPTKKNILCKKEHRFVDKFANLSDSQEFYVEGIRHHCAGCAYEQGFNDAIKGKQRKIRFSELNISQAGTVRHKDPKEAYELGYEDGLKSKND